MGDIEKGPVYAGPLPYARVLDSAFDFCSVLLVLRISSSRFNLLRCYFEGIFLYFDLSFHDW